jgi:hypothetical protein
MRRVALIQIKDRAIISAAKLLTKDEARRIAANIAKRWAKYRRACNLPLT